MLFNSLPFAIFLPIVFAIYWSIAKNVKAQNIFLLAASYFFYGWWDWKILLLLVISTLVFYGLGIAISNAQSQKKKSLFTTLGVIFGITTLIYFKYANFFISSFKELFESIGLQSNLHTFNILVPIGISFYTFRLLSYVIDINRGKYEPTQDIIAFSAYVAFFPSILSGPIDRPNSLIPQLQQKRIFNYALAVDGLRQILWGLFKKMVIADNCATIANQIFDNSANYSGSTLIMGAIFYTFQLYTDFSGYSDMAIGVAKLLGFRLMKNFNYPFFAQNIADFWRRWHISLTSWLTDYVFMPLNVEWRDAGKFGMMLAIIVNFAICGLWHGANWTFVLWGCYHGFLFIPLILTGAMFKKTKIESYKWGLPKLQTLCRMLLVFFLVVIGMILFRAESIAHAWEYISEIFSPSLFTMPGNGLSMTQGTIFIFAFVLIEWFGRENQYAIEKLGIKWKRLFRWFFYSFLVFMIAMFMKTEDIPFIYFQF
ncbi:MAG: MBOAT family protein [Bacteroidales bacterium]|jgi:D-alanyl-lipoteichoic acid acyltransferase DltB (MBOAT superfamily)|nr:MBOAT family protein [Bacteroidales bacterium]